METILLFPPVLFVVVFGGFALVAWIAGTSWRAVKRAFWRRRLQPIIED